MHPVRSLSALALGALVIVGLAACSSGQAPGWTYAPPPTPTVAPSTAPSAAGSSAAPATAAASSAASAAPGASAVPPASAAPSSGGTGGTTVLNEVAKNVQFQTLTLEAPAGQPFQIAFDNQDASIAHNIQIADGGGAMVFEGELVTGVAQTTYNVGALPAGAYKFSCKVHPNMVGELTVK